MNCKKKKNMTELFDTVELDFEKDPERELRAKDAHVLTKELNELNNDNFKKVPESNRAKDANETFHYIVNAAYMSPQQLQLAKYLNRLGQWEWIYPPKTPENINLASQTLVNLERELFNVRQRDFAAIPRNEIPALDPQFDIRHFWELAPDSLVQYKSDEQKQIETLVYIWSNINSFYHPFPSVKEAFDEVVTPSPPQGTKRKRESEPENEDYLDLAEALQESLELEETKKKSSFVKQPSAFRQPPPKKPKLETKIEREGKSHDIIKAPKPIASQEAKLKKQTPFVTFVHMGLLQGKKPDINNLDFIQISQTATTLVKILEKAKMSIPPSTLLKPIPGNNLYNAIVTGDGKNYTSAHLEEKELEDALSTIAKKLSSAILFLALTETPQIAVATRPSVLRPEKLLILEFVRQQDKFLFRVLYPIHVDGNLLIPNAPKSQGR
jgi:hypothetical protein